MCGISRLEHEVAAAAQTCMSTGQRGRPLPVADKDLCDVARHRHHLDGQRWECGCIAEQPDDPVGAGLRSSDGERSLRRINTGHCEPAYRESAGERAGATTDVEHGASTELVDDGLVVVQVAPVAIDVVVDRRQSRVSEDRVRHGPNSTTRFRNPHRLDRPLPPSARSHRLSRRTLPDTALVDTCLEAVSDTRTLDAPGLDHVSDIMRPKPGILSIGPMAKNRQATRAESWMNHRTMGSAIDAIVIVATAHPFMVRMFDTDDWSRFDRPLLATPGRFRRWPRQRPALLSSPM